MPPINGPAATAGVIAISVAVAAAIAVYESPELQRMANDLRRRIAIALHSFGDSITPQERENLFNRPEDAEGFLESRGLGAGMGAGGEHGVEADDETRRRQREELMYWNAMLQEKKEKENREDSEKVHTTRRRTSTRGSSFDDFLRQDDNAEKGTYVYQTGHETQNNEALVRRRADGLRGLNASMYTNPFADEHGIDDDIALENSLMDPEKDELLSDIYSATDLGQDEPSRNATQSPSPAIPTLVEVGESTSQPEQPQSSEHELGRDEFMTAGQGDREGRQDAYSLIQAWAKETSNPTSNSGFYSPLPETPEAPLSEPELISDGEMTPTDSGSLAGSGVDVAEEGASARSGSQGRYYDVVSDDEGMMTPASWTEVGSVVSESDSGAVHSTHLPVSRIS
ncbi:Uu.00g010190.m01.CDS01 [Anthostomella pinea]|uniref:Uu.00g010190.m01.CDS01 n=1 Tax=Anthostomella pinea TaxID=933095 RepID=A0AAI8VYF1_9PEZI|nr:Uu.00g010190.m01.CDS01 [Anthostomella pinea]